MEHSGGYPLHSYPSTPMYDSLNENGENHSSESLRLDQQPHIERLGDKERVHLQRSRFHGDFDVRRRMMSWARKLGATATLVILVGNVVILVCIALLAFLWYADARSPLWLDIITHDWMPKAVTIISEVLKVAVGFQIGTCSAMLAAVALEKRDVELNNVAAVALTKTSVLGSGAVLGLFGETGWLWRLVRRGRLVLPLFITAFLLIFSFLQAITVILVSDLGLQSLPARASITSKPFGFQLDSNGYINGTSRASVWNLKPQTYPTFAEHSEEPYVAEGVDDTGVTIRALLPFAAAVDRQTLREYRGKTAVIDTRVTCQVPSLPLATVEADIATGMLTLEGTVAASRSTPRLANFTSQVIDGDFVYNQPVPFTCFAPPGSTSDDSPPWRISVCQLGEGGGNGVGFSGGLVSEFMDPNSAPKTGTSADVVGVNSTQLGTAYLLLNVTLGDTKLWQSVTEGGAKPPAVTQHGPWLDLVYSNNDLIMSVSLCYSGFDATEMPVDITSNKNRTEPLPTYDLKSGTFGFDVIRTQLGQNGSIPKEERGILDLSPQRSNWLALDGETSPYEPWIRLKASIAATQDGNRANYTAMLWQSGFGEGTGTQLGNWITPDPMHTLLFQEIVKSGGSVAFGLQALLTMMSSMAYYDQLAQFDNLGDMQQAFFLTSNAARRSAGFAAVVAVVAIHLILVLAVTSMFLAKTRHSMLGAVWQAVAQLVDPRAIDFFDAASRMSDHEVQQYLVRNQRSMIRIGTSPSSNGDGIGLVHG